jgi:glycosyltransferase involved in cell wall biosynthesis
MEQTGGVHFEPLQIALITDGLFPFAIGGMQKHSTLLAQSLLDSNTPLILVHPHTNDAVYSHFGNHPLLTAVAVDFPAGSAFPGHYLYANYRYSKRVRKALEAFHEKPLICYAQGFAGWDLMVNRIPACKVMLNLHGLEMFQPLRGMKTRLQAALLRWPARKLLRRCDAAVSLGGKLTALIQRVAPRTPIVELPVGISSAWLENSRVSTGSAELRRFLFVGRNEWRKGLDILIPLVQSMISDKKTKFYFDFIGEIPDALQFNDERITFHGPMRDEEAIRKIYSEADILVCPSYAEGMPTVILEAMASGMAIIATDVGATAVLVNEGNGLLISPGDLHALAGAVGWMMQLPAEKLEELKSVSAQRAAQFNWQQVAEQTKRALLQLVPGA